MKTQQPNWMKVCDPADIAEALVEATVDCYGEDEQSSGLIEMAAQELAFPFPGTVMGESIIVVDSAASEFNAYGLDLIVEHKKKRFAIGSSSVELSQPLPDGHLYLAALLKWNSRR